MPTPTPTPQLTVPGTPTITSARVTWLDSFTVEWIPPGNNGGAEIQGYHARYRVVGSDHWEHSFGYGRFGNTYTIWKAKVGAQYEVQVRAYNSVGNGSWSAPVITDPVGTQPEPTPLPTPTPISTRDEQTERAVVKIYKENLDGTWQGGTGVIFHTERDTGYILTDYRFMLNLKGPSYRRSASQPYKGFKFFVVVENDRFNRRLVENSDGILEWVTNDEGTIYRSWGIDSRLAPVGIHPALGIAVLRICCAKEIVQSSSGWFGAFHSTAGEYESLPFSKDILKIGDEVTVVGNSSTGGYQCWDDPVTSIRSNVRDVQMQAEHHPPNLIWLDTELASSYIGAPLLSANGEILGLIQSQAGGDTTGSAILSKDIIPKLNSLLGQPDCHYATSNPYSPNRRSSTVREIMLIDIFEVPRKLNVPSWENPKEHSWSHTLKVRENFNDHFRITMNNDGNWEFILQYEYGSVIDTHITDTGNVVDEGIPFNTGQGERNHLMFISRDEYTTFEFLVNGVHVPLNIEQDDLDIIERANRVGVNTRIDTNGQYYVAGSYSADVDRACVPYPQ